MPDRKKISYSQHFSKSSIIFEIKNKEIGGTGSF